MFLRCSYSDLCLAFGAPNAWDARKKPELKKFIDNKISAYSNSNKWDGKVVCEWEIKQPGFYVRIYDWKQTKAYEDGSCLRDDLIPEHRKEIIDQYADSVEDVQEWNISSAENCRESLDLNTLNMLLHKVKDATVVKYDKYGRDAIKLTAVQTF